MNLVILAGKLAKPPELRKFESGSSLLRSVLSVRTHAPRRRVDAVPITLWDPPADHEVLSADAGTRLWVVGTVQRRFWSGSEGRQSRLEVVAHHMELSPAEVATTDLPDEVVAGPRG